MKKTLISFLFLICVFLCAFTSCDGNPKTKVSKTPEPKKEVVIDSLSLKAVSYAQDIFELGEGTYENKFFNGMYYTGSVSVSKATSYALNFDLAVSKTFGGTGEKVVGAINVTDELNGIFSVKNMTVNGTSVNVTDLNSAVNKTNELKQALESIIEEFYSDDFLIENDEINEGELEFPTENKVLLDGIKVISFKGTEDRLTGTINGYTWEYTEEPELYKFNSATVNEDAFILNFVNEIEKIGDDDFDSGSVVLDFSISKFSGVTSGKTNKKAFSISVDCPTLNISCEFDTATNTLIYNFSGSLAVEVSVGTKTLKFNLNKFTVAKDWKLDKFFETLDADLSFAELKQALGVSEFSFGLEINGTSYSQTEIENAIAISVGSLDL